MADITKKLTSQEALAEAILAAQQQPGTSILSKASFGQYTTSASEALGGASSGGWYWQLDFTTVIGDNGTGVGDSFPARTRKVIAAWTAYMEKQAEDRRPTVTAWRAGICPDGGTCHHACISACFRVRSCGPLSGVYGDDEWPAEVVLAHQEEDGSA